MKKELSYVSIFVAAVLLIVGAALWEGSLTARWKDPKDEQLDSIKMGIHDIPHIIGDWTGDISTERREMDDIIAKEAGAEESLARTYTHSGISRPVSINIICGFARKVAIHTPDACYVGAGFHIVGEIEKVEFRYMTNPLAYLSYGGAPPTAGEKDEKAAVNEVPQPKQAFFKTALFERESQYGTERQRVFWGWKSADSGWEVPELPRQRWGKGPLAKLYFSTPEGPEDTLANNPAFVFAQALLPELDYLLSGEFTENVAQAPAAGDTDAALVAPGTPGMRSVLDAGPEKAAENSSSPFTSRMEDDLEEENIPLPPDTPIMGGGLGTLTPDAPAAGHESLPALTPLDAPAAAPSPEPRENALPALDMEKLPELE